MKHSPIGNSISVSRANRNALDTLESAAEGWLEAKAAGRDTSRIEADLLRAEQALEQGSTA